MERGFSTYHPIVNFTYFVIIISASMLFAHPIFIGISLISSIIYSILINKERSKKILMFGSITSVIVTLANGIFVHKGITVLFFVKGNPITLESILYGALSGCMMLSVVMWFACYNEIVTSDKFIYIFGKALPSIALVISMTLRLIPKLIEQTKVIAKSQQVLGLDYSEGNIFMKLKSCMRIISILVTWALEDAVLTADSMKSRGYGLKGRTNFSIFVFIKRDGILLTIILVILVLLVTGYMKGLGTLMFYPSIAHIDFNLNSVVRYLSFMVISIIPIIIEIMEGNKWKQSI
jgi:energy-coupling factor transport system permease protein